MQAFLRWLVALAPVGCECFPGPNQDLDAGAQYHGIDPTIAPRAYHGTFAGTLEWTSGSPITDLSLTISKSEHPSTVEGSSCGSFAFGVPVSTRWVTADGALDVPFDMIVQVDEHGRLDSVEVIHGKFPASLLGSGARPSSSGADGGVFDASTPFDPAVGVPRGVAGAMDVAVELDLRPSSRPTSALFMLGVSSSFLAKARF
jgi:hypothetical protein